MMKEPIRNCFLGSGLLAAIASSLCCLLPVVSAVFGLGVFGAASIFETIRPYLLITAFSALGFSFYQTYFRRENCQEGEVCATGTVSRLHLLILWSAAIAVLTFALFPFLTGYIAALGAKTTPADETDQTDVIRGNQSERSETIIFAVEGMTCEGCALHLNAELKKLKGVISAAASYRNKSLQVVYDPEQVTIEQIKQTVNDTGYVAK